MNEDAESRIMEFLQTMNEKFTGAIENLSVSIDSNSERLSEIKSRVSILEGEQQLNMEEKEENDEAASNITFHQSTKSSTRKSRFQRDLEEASSSQEHQQRVVVINMPTPEYKHIYLDSTDLADFSTFLINWLEWERTYSLRLEPPRIMSRRLRSMLQYNHGITEAEFHKLTPDTFMQLMAKETEVVDKRDFALTLKHALKNVRQLEWEKVTPNTHQKFFQAILRRKELFLKIFQVLMECNKDKCPSLKGREFGLANIFLSTISDSYNASIKAELLEINNQNYPRVEDFITAYVAKAKEHYDVSRGVKRIPYAGSDYKTKEPEKHSGDSQKRKQWIPREQYERQKKQQPAGTEPATQRVNYVNVMDESSSSDSEPDEVRGKDFDESDTEQDESAHCVTVPEDDIFAGEQTLAALGSGTSGGETQSSKGCVNFAIYGNCFRGNDCKNVSGHTEEMAKGTRQWLIKKLATVEREGYTTTVPKRDHTRP